MPKSNRRVTVTRTVTFTATIDIPNRPEETDPNALTFLGGAAGTSGTLTIGELLAGSIANNGSVSRGNWSITGTSTNVESYGTRPQNTAMTLGQRVASVKPPTGYETAVNKLFFVSVAGTTANVSTEPNWNLTNGLTTTDGTVTFRTLPKFYTPSNYTQSTVYAVGSIFRPAATSMKEYLVVTQNTGAATTPTWTSNDTLGATVAFQTGGSAICISGCVAYAPLTAYGLGANVKPTAGSSEEYLVTAAGTTDASTSASLTASVGSTVTIGGCTFKRII